MKNDKKRIMILGASDLQIPLIERAKARDLFVVVVSPNKNEKGKQIADIGIEADVRDKTYVCEKAKALDINGIITDQTDIAVRSVAYVAECLNLPGIGYEKAVLFTDKYLMREKCKELGIKTLDYQLVDNIKDAKSFLVKLGGQAIIKPVDSQGSRGVTFIDSENKLIETFEETLHYSSCGKVIIEQVAHGREFVVEGLAFNGAFTNLIIGDTYYFDIPDVFSATKRVFPSSASRKLQSEVLELNKKIITGFGLKQGITHSEFIMDGKDIYLIETAARGGGVFISSDLISLSTGLCTEDFLIDICLGTCNGMPALEKDKCSCCYLAFYLPQGKVVKCDCIDNVLSLPFTHRNNLNNIKVGLETKPFHDKTARFNIIISGHDKIELKKNIASVKKLLNNIKIKTSEGALKTPIWK